MNTQSTFTMTSLAERIKAAKTVGQNLPSSGELLEQLYLDNLPISLTLLARYLDNPAKINNLDVYKVADRLPAQDKTGSRRPWSWHITTCAHCGRQFEFSRQSEFVMPEPCFLCNNWDTRLSWNHRQRCYNLALALNSVVSKLTEESYFLLSSFRRP